MILMAAFLALLAAEKPRQAIESLFAEISIFLYDSFWPLLGIVGFLSIHSLVAILIDHKAMFQMFINFGPPEEQDLLHKSSIRTTLFRCANWIISWIFVGSLVSVVNSGNHAALMIISGPTISLSYKQNSHLSSARADVIICFLTMSYLLGLFSMNTLARALQSRQPRPRALVGIPSAYVVVLCSIIANLDGPVHLKAGVIFLTLSILTTCYMHVLLNTKTKGPQATLQKRHLNLSYSDLNSSRCPANPTSRVYIVKGDVMPADLSTWQSICFTSQKLVDMVLNMPYQLTKDTISQTAVSAVVLVCSLKAAIPMSGSLLMGSLTAFAINTLRKSMTGTEPKPNLSSAMEARRLATYPPPYPNGWYKLADSADIKPQELKRVIAFERKFVIFRGENGIVSVIDAYCPHLGADISAGGKVIGNSIECPFHQWQFGQDGRCTKIPYSGSIPTSATVKMWPSIEYYGNICVYFDAEKRKSPPYYPPFIPDLDGGHFVYRGQLDRRINMHLMEFVENSADFMHFDPLHGAMHLPFTSIPIPGVKIKHEAGWKPDDKDRHIAYFFDKAELCIKGKVVPRTKAEAMITLIGPAGLTYFNFKTPLGKIVLFHTHTPIAPSQQRVSFRWYADKAVPRFLVWYVVGNWISQWQMDLMVWENKRYTLKPTLAKGDGPMFQMRRWFKQFYSESSDTIHKQLDW